MSATLLLQHLERLSEAPDAIPRLRRFILDLAVRGKLVPQDPNDEPAAELLKRIQAEKAKTNNGEANRERRSSVHHGDGIPPFPLPAGWTLTDLGSVSLKITDGTHKTPTYMTSGVPFVSVRDFSSGKLSLSNTRFIAKEEHELLYKRCDPKPGDILLGRIGTLGKAVLIDVDIAFSLFVSVALIRFSHNYFTPEFFRLFLNSPLVESSFDRIKVGGGTHTNKLNLRDIQTVAFPLPPLAEQYRIAAKVDEMMTLCDQLEAAKDEREERRDQLVAASLQRLNQPVDNEEVFRKDVRFTFNHLPSITTRPAHIKQVRQTILNLAVRGKLVSQDSNDEPAAELLKRIQAEKSRRINLGEIRAPRAEESIEAVEELFPLPSHWGWVRLSSVGLIVGGGTPPSGDLDNFEDGGKGVPWLTPADLGKQQSLFVSHGKRDLSQKGLAASSVTLMPAGSVLFTSRAPIGYTAIASNPIMTNQGFKSVVPYIADLSRFIAIYFQAFAPWIDGKASGTTFREVSGKIVAGLPFPLPPLTEQHRIVAKVAELMALCDQLEAQLITTATDSRRLLEVVLHERQS